MTNNQCAAGNKRFQELDPARFKPTKLSAEVNGKRVAICPFCDQATAVKKDGFFVSHLSSQQGAGKNRGQTAGNPSGEPARERRRGV